MHVLALEPYYGGSHKAFLDGWIANSRHQWTLLTLPAYKWKWRMRHAPLTFAEQLRKYGPESFACVIASDMLDLPLWRGMVDVTVAQLPTVAYFHENQLTYPVTEQRTRDLHFAFSNIATAITADEVWFNSRYHRREFLTAADNPIARMPDYQPSDLFAPVRDKSHVCSPGLPHIEAPQRSTEQPLHIVWAARWEHDKNPEMLFDTLRRVRDAGASFRLSAIGEQFDDSPDCFDAARSDFSHHIVRWGFQESRSDYERALQEADLFVSTADHEFFGIAAAEAILAGCRPLLPNRLAYPDLVSGVEESYRNELLYDGGVDDLSSRIIELAGAGRDSQHWSSIVQSCRDALLPLTWGRLAPEYDNYLEELNDA